MTIPQQTLSSDAIDLVPVEVVFVPVMKQPNLPHQFDLRFVLCKSMVQPVCNCDWTGWGFDPADESKLVQALAQYRRHVTAVKAAATLEDA